ncbi:hypothetical protein V6237_20185, partial [Pseudoalteromonas carrageenovora]
GQAFDLVTVSEQSADVEYMYVPSTDIPKYDITLKQDQVDALNNRTRAASDFYNGVTSAVAGQTVLFGEDIVYKI